MLFINLVASSVKNVIVPTINPCSDGSISFDFYNLKTGHWLTSNVKIDSATCYGDDGNKQDVIDGEICMKDIYVWLEKYMTE